MGVVPLWLRLLLEVSWTSPLELWTSTTSRAAIGGVPLGDALESAPQLLEILTPD